MENLVKIKTEELEDSTWKVGFLGHQFAVKDFVEPVVSVVEWGKEYIGSAIEPSPPASIAWAGVCLLLPVSLESITVRACAADHTELFSLKKKARVEGIDKVASIIRECSIRESVYRRRY